MQDEKLNQTAYELRKRGLGWGEVANELRQCSQVAVSAASAYSMARMWALNANDKWPLTQSNYIPRNRRIINKAIMRDRRNGISTREICSRYGVSKDLANRVIGGN